MNTFFKKYLLKLGLIVGGFVIVSIGLSHAVSAYSITQIDNMLYGGSTTAYNWDQTCKNNLQTLRAEGQAPRTAIDNSPSYVDLTWASARGAGSQTAPVDVNYGTTTVPLQLNSVVFLCAALVNPDNKGADFARTSGNGVITSPADVNDRDPNPASGTGVNDPALLSDNYQIVSISVSGNKGNVTGVAPGQQYNTSRDNNSRYWFSNPVDFNYVSKSPITTNQTITITFMTKSIATYVGSVYQCTRGGKLVNPGSATSFGNCSSSPAPMSISFQINSKYTLTPTISVNGSTSTTTTESGSTAAVHASVSEAKNDTNSNQTDWRVTELHYSPGTTLTAADIAAKSSSALAPCQAFTSTGRTTCTTYGEDKTKTFTNTPAVADYAYSTGDYPVGTYICFVDSVSTPTQSASPLWSHSAMVCMVVGKQPKVDITGGDVIAGRPFTGGALTTSNIDTSTTVKGTTTYGSWVEDAAFASGTISGLGSGAAFSGGLQNSSGICDYSALSFTNAGSSVSCDANLVSPTGYIGGYASNQSIPDIEASFPATTPLPTTSVDLSTIAAGTYSTTASSITISSGSGTVEPGKTFILNAPNTDVIINGNINYTTSTLHSLSDIPQVVIIAKDITIDDISPNNIVTNVDAWLIGLNSINTCDLTGSSAPLTINTCTDPLLVNGPVMTQHLYLNRTAGSGTDAQSGDPAETFNLRPDAYLWAYNQALESGKIQSVYLTELAPRF